MKRVWFGTVLVTFLASGGLAFAHHSFAATYDTEAEPVRIEGELVQFLYRNPHSFLHVMAPDKEGVMRRWAIEWGSLGQLQRGSQVQVRRGPGVQGVGIKTLGITRATLKPGDHLIVVGTPSKFAADYRLLVESIERPADGWKWSGYAD